MGKMIDKKVCRSRMIDKKSLTDWSIGGRGGASACIATLYEKLVTQRSFPCLTTKLKRECPIYGPLNYLFALICKKRGLTLVTRCFSLCRREEYLRASGWGNLCFSCYVACNPAPRTKISGKMDCCITIKTSSQYSSCFRFTKTIRVIRLHSLS